MNFRFLDFEKYQDFGDEYFLQVLTSYPKFALLDITLRWDEFPATEIIPMILLGIGNECLCGLTIRWKKFYLSVDIIGWRPRNLQWYRDNRNE